MDMPIYCKKCNKETDHCTCELQALRAQNAVLRAALEKIGKAARLGSSLLAADIAVFSAEALAATKEES